jgi:MarR family transcriptional regulator, organic hydroperoxide resistance regulator
MEQTIGLLLVQICRAHRNQVAGALSQLRIHAGQDHVLHRLAIAEGTTQAALADAVCVDASTMTKTLARLERDGLIARKENPADARESRVYLTDRGRSLLQPVVEIWSESEERLVRVLTGTERSQLRRVLQRILADVTPAPSPLVTPRR